MLHGAMKHAIGPRKEIAVRSIFNILGPLTNPAGAKRQLLGVFSPHLTELMANVLRELGSEHVMVVHGNGLDELHLDGQNRVSELKDGNIKTYEIKADYLGLKSASLEALKGGTSEDNALILKSIFSGEEGAKADISIFNAGAAIYLGQGADSLESGIEKARQSLKDGKAAASLEGLVKASAA